MVEENKNNYNCQLMKLQTDSFTKQEKTRQLEILEQFAKTFKQERIRLGFTQSDVGLAIGHLYGSNFSQTTISRFEALNLSFKNMSKLKPLLEKWLKLTNEAITNVKQGQDFFYPFIGNVDEKQTRKKRTSFDKDTLDLLNRLFIKNPKPTSTELLAMSSDCGFDVRVIRVWFYNRRQRQKRMKEQHSQLDSELLDSDSSVPSRSEDIDDSLYINVPPLLHVRQLSSFNARSPNALSPHEHINLNAHRSQPRFSSSKFPRRSQSMLKRSMTNHFSLQHDSSQAALYQPNPLPRNCDFSKYFLPPPVSSKASNPSLPHTFISKSS